MKCPSDCSGGYMVPKVMCSICIEEYSGYNGGYGRYSIISSLQCMFYKKQICVTVLWFHQFVITVPDLTITIVNLGINPSPPGCLAEDLQCFALIMEYEMM